MFEQRRLVRPAKARDRQPVAGLGKTVLYIAEHERLADRVTIGTGRHLPARRAVGQEDRLAAGGVRTVRLGGEHI